MSGFSSVFGNVRQSSFRLPGLRALYQFDSCRVKWRAAWRISNNFERLLFTADCDLQQQRSSNLLNTVEPPLPPLTLSTSVRTVLNFDTRLSCAGAFEARVSLQCTVAKNESDFELFVARCGHWRGSQR